MKSFIAIQKCLIFVTDIRGEIIIVCRTIVLKNVFYSRKSIGWRIKFIQYINLIVWNKFECDCIL